MVEMVRKILAFLLTCGFVLFTPTLIVMLGFSLAFFDEQRLVDELIPQSYDLVVKLVAEKYAGPAQDTAGNIEQRIRNAIGRADYVEIFTEGVKSFYSIRRGVIDLQPFRRKLKEKMPVISERMPVCADHEEQDGFRFCRPAGIESFGTGNSRAEAFAAAPFGDIFDKEIPPNFTINADNVQVMQIVSDFFAIKNYLWIAIAIVVCVYLLLMLIIWYPNRKAFALWSAFGAVFLAGFLMLISISFNNLPQILFAPSELLPAQKEFLSFIVNQPVKYFNLAAIAAGVAGAALFLINFITEKKK